MYSTSLYTSSHHFSISSSSKTALSFYIMPYVFTVQQLAQ